MSREGLVNGFQNLLEEGLLTLGLNTDKRILSLLEKYIEEIELFNHAYGLVKVKDREELIVKHILDSLAPLNIIRGLVENSTAVAAAPKAPAVAPPAAAPTPPVVASIPLAVAPPAVALTPPAVALTPPAVAPKKPAVADVGSGAGLPGIPLAVCLNGAEFTLIERMARRAGFLRDVQALLGLENVRIEEAEMEKLKPGQFDLVVFRAFRPLETPILKGLLRLLTPGGVLAAYKGRRKSIEEEMTAIKNYEVIPLEVPFLEEERHLVLIRP